VYRGYLEGVKRLGDEGDYSLNLVVTSRTMGLYHHSLLSSWRDALLIENRAKITLIKNFKQRFNPNNLI
jgi:hypothetical protein